MPDTLISEDEHKNYEYSDDSSYKFEFQLQFWSTKMKINIEIKNETRNVYIKTSNSFVVHSIAEISNQEAIRVFSQSAFEKLKSEFRKKVVLKCKSIAFIETICSVIMFITNAFSENFQLLLMDEYLTKMQSMYHDPSKHSKKVCGKFRNGSS